MTVDPENVTEDLANRIHECLVAKGVFDELRRAKRADAAKVAEAATKLLHDEKLVRKGAQLHANRLTDIRPLDRLIVSLDFRHEYKDEAAGKRQIMELRFDESRNGKVMFNATLSGAAGEHVIDLDLPED